MRMEMTRGLWLVWAIGAWACGGPGEADGGLADAGPADAGPAIDGGQSLDAGPVEPPDWPPAPPWEPPFELDEEVGWGESTEALCSPVAGRPRSFEVWADARGVFALVGIFNNSFDPADPVAPNGHALVHHDGVGWATWWTSLQWTDPEGRALRGRDEGAIFVSSGLPTCSVWRVDGPGDVHCHSTGVAPLGGSAWDVFVEGDGTEWYSHELGVRRVRDGVEDTHTGVGAGRRIWGAGDELVVLTEEELVRGNVVSRSLERWELDAGCGSFTSMWAVDIDEVYLGCLGAIFRFDGAELDVVVLEPAGEELVRGLWSDRGDGARSLYFITEHTFGVVREGAVALLVDFREGFPVGGEVGFAGIWGSEERGEVYLAIRDDRYHAYECGATFLLYYDGTSLRRM